MRDDEGTFGAILAELAISITFPDQTRPPRKLASAVAISDARQHTSPPCCPRLGRTLSRESRVVPNRQGS